MCTCFVYVLLLVECLLQTDVIYVLLFVAKCLLQIDVGCKMFAMLVECRRISEWPMFCRNVDSFPFRQISGAPYVHFLAKVMPKISVIFGMTCARN